MDFVSRAGQKLEHALQTFGISVADAVVADLGCSTGGFTDCLLTRGARKVYAVDTGYGVLDWKLRQDERVVVLERQNALHVELPELVQFVSVDVSWTPQRLIVPRALALLGESGDIVSLLKPHYEAPKQLIRKGLLPEAFVDETVQNVVGQLSDAGISVRQVERSPITGKKKENAEFLLWITK
jgi:23S rRNA (cytidine1920-2'-O)/16S rRNA (cytidine1409-2'-O)-methyltransferase